jgi:hypothetical protein
LFMYIFFLFLSFFAGCIDYFMQHLSFCTVT